MMVVFLAENARIPVDDPNTHLELTMIHEVMVLDHSGPDFALIQYGACLKLWILGAVDRRGCAAAFRAGSLWILPAGLRGWSCWPSSRASSNRSWRGCGCSAFRNF